MRNHILNCHLNETSPNQLNQRKTLAATGSIWKLRQPPPRNPPARQVSSYRACRNKKSYWLCQFPRFIELASGYRRCQERLTTLMPLSKSAKACIYAIFRNIWLAYFHQVFCPNHPINQYFFNSPRHGTRTGTRTGPWEGQDGQDVQYCPILARCWCSRRTRWSRQRRCTPEGPWKWEVGGHKDLGSQANNLIVSWMSSSSLFIFYPCQPKSVQK